MARRPCFGQRVWPGSRPSDGVCPRVNGAADDDGGGSLISRLGVRQGRRWPLSLVAACPRRMFVTGVLHVRDRGFAGIYRGCWHLREGADPMKTRNSVLTAVVLMGAV